MLLPLRNSLNGGHIYVINNTLHLQYGVTILTEDDFSEGETLFV